MLVRVEELLVAVLHEEDLRVGVGVFAMSVPANARLGALRGRLRPQGEGPQRQVLAEVPQRLVLKGLAHGGCEGHGVSTAAHWKKAAGGIADAVLAGRR